MEIKVVLHADESLLEVARLFSEKGVSHDHPCMKEPVKAEPADEAPVLQTPTENDPKIIEPKNDPVENPKEKESSKITLEEVRSWATRLVNENKDGQKQLQEIFSKLNVTRLSEIPSDMYVHVLVKIKMLLGVI